MAYIQQNKILNIFLKYKFWLFILLLILFSSSYYIFGVLNFEKSVLHSNVEKNTDEIEIVKDKSSIKSTNGYITALILGIDSRDLEFDGEVFKGKDRNTDTIIQVVYDYSKNNIFLISIPRDTGYEVEEDCLKQDNDKAINRLYKITEDSDCDATGIDIISKYTEKITGFHNDYYAMISFETFHQVFEEIGEENEGEFGLWIDVPEGVYEYYPVGDNFEYFSLQKGNQFLNSEMLLRYSRSRKSTSDFVRSQRQHIVLEGLKKHIFESNIFYDPIKIWGIYNAFKKNALYSKISLEEIVEAISLREKLENAKMYNLILNDEFGGQNNYIVRPSSSPPFGQHNRKGFYLTPVDYDKDCCKEDNYFRVKQYLASIVRNPDVYLENAKVAIYTQDGDFSKLPESFSDWLISEPPVFNLVESDFTFSQNLGEEIVIIDLSGNEKMKTLDYLSESLDVNIIDDKKIRINPAHGEDIAIIIRNQI